MSGYLDKEDWLISFEDKEREFYDRKKKLETAISELEFKRANCMKSDPAEAESCKGGIEEGKRLLKKLNDDATKAAKPFDAIRPKFCESTVFSFCAVIAFCLTIPEMMYETMTLRVIGGWFLLWFVYYMVLVFAFNVVDYTLSKVRYPKKYRKLKTILIDIAICAMCALIYSYVN